jgi:hypothetical protein
MQPGALFLPERPAGARPLLVAATGGVFLVEPAERVARAAESPAEANPVAPTSIPRAHHQNNSAARASTVLSACQADAIHHYMNRRRWQLR